MPSASITSAVELVQQIVTVQPVIWQGVTDFGRAFAKEYTAPLGQEKQARILAQFDNTCAQALPQPILEAISGHVVKLAEKQEAFLNKMAEKSGVPGCTFGLLMIMRQELVPAMLQGPLLTPREKESIQGFGQYLVRFADTINQGAETQSYDDMVTIAQGFMQGDIRRAITRSLPMPAPAAAPGAPKA